MEYESKGGFGSTFNFVGSEDILRDNPASPTGRSRASSPTREIDASKLGLPIPGIFVVGKQTAAVHVQSGGRPGTDRRRKAKQPKSVSPSLKSNDIRTGARGNENRDHNPVNKWAGGGRRNGGTKGAKKAQAVGRSLAGSLDQLRGEVDALRERVVDPPEEVHVAVVEEKKKKELEYVFSDPYSGEYRPVPATIAPEECNRVAGIRALLERLVTLDVAFDLEEGDPLSPWLFRGCMALGLASMITRSRLPLLVGGAGAMYSCAFRKRRVRYVFKNFRSSSGVDLRADSLSTLDLKHPDPILVVVTKQDCWTADVDLVVSVELLVQLTTQTVLQLNESDKDVADRIKWTAAKVQSINLDRYSTLFGPLVSQSTCLVAFAIHKQNQQLINDCPFPNCPPLSLSDWALRSTDLVTDTVRLNYLFQGPLNLGPEYLRAVMVCVVVGLLYKQVSDVMSVDLLLPIQIPMILKPWRWASESVLLPTLQNQILSGWRGLECLLRNGCKIIWFHWQQMSIWTLNIGWVKPHILCLVKRILGRRESRSMGLLLVLGRL